MSLVSLPCTSLSFTPGCSGCCCVVQVHVPHGCDPQSPDSASCTPHRDADPTSVPHPALDPAFPRGPTAQHTPCALWVGRCVHRPRLHHGLHCANLSRRVRGRGRRRWRWCRWACVVLQRPPSVCQGACADAPGGSQCRGEATWAGGSGHHPTDGCSVDRCVPDAQPHVGSVWCNNDGNTHVEVGVRGGAG